MNFERYPRIIEAASWRLASEIVRRHPNFYNVFIGSPGGGMYDVLYLMEKKKTERSTKILLNRNGSIQVHDAKGGNPSNFYGEWRDYLLGDSVKFLNHVEKLAGLPQVKRIPSTTPLTLTYRFLAQFLHVNFDREDGFRIINGMVDTAGYGGGRVKVLMDFNFDSKLLERTNDDFLGLGLPEYRFWIITEGKKQTEGFIDFEPLFAVEQTTTQLKILGRDDVINLYELFKTNKRSVETVVKKINEAY